MHYYYGPMVDRGDWWLVGIICAGLFAVFLALLALVFMRLMKHRHSNWPQHRDPLDIARDRYAKGEIDKEQFEQLTKDLKS